MDQRPTHESSHERFLPVELRGPDSVRDIAVGRYDRIGFSMHGLIFATQMHEFCAYRIEEKDATMRLDERVASGPIRMSNAFELPENVASRTTSSRCWNGVNVDLHELTCTVGFLFRIGREESTRLSAQFEQVGRDHAEPRSAPNTPNPHAYKPRSMYFAPAEMELWAYSADTRYIKCATISFDVNMLQHRLGISESVGLMDVPHLRINDDRL